MLQGRVTYVTLPFAVKCRHTGRWAGLSLYNDSTVGLITENDEENHEESFTIDGRRIMT
jgi:hypothetical protein